MIAMHGPSSRRRFAPVALILAVLWMVSCNDDESREPVPRGKLETIRGGTLTVGSEIPYEPFEFGRGPGYVGFDVDVVRQVGERLGLEVRFVKTSFEPSLRQLAQDRFDMVASAVPITAERRETVDFSDPYLPADQSLMVKRESAIGSVDDLKGRAVAAQLGTEGADYARDKTDAKTVRTFDLIDDAYLALEAGQVDAVIHDFAVLKHAERGRPRLSVVQVMPTGGQYGFAFAKHSDPLRDAVNGALERLKRDGTYAEIYRKWFRADPPGRVLE